MDNDQALRVQLVALLDWQDAHAGFDNAVAGIPPALLGVRPEGLPYSAWQLLEHLRLAQADILDFCLNPDYVEPAWPAAFWPKAPEPPSQAAWDEAVSAFRRDREALKQICTDRAVDLFTEIPHGNGQTYLREILLAADHNVYHLGQLVALRRLLGIWRAD